MATPALLQDSLPARDTNPKPAPRPDNYWLHGGLFLITLLSTTLVGMRYADNFRQGLFPLSSDADIFPYQWTLSHLHLFAAGLPFSCTLLGILLTHEFGHYFACRQFGIRATLPYMLPAPSLSGTAGAVIRLKSRIKSRAALLAIGALGPVAGFAVALITTAIGIALSQPVVTAPAQLVFFHKPLLFTLLMRLLDSHSHISSAPYVLWHPVLIASWIGILITSLNLLPAGQLDGGHILYALSPRVHAVVSKITIAALLFCGIFFWAGWLLWAAPLLLPAMRHPVVPVEEKLSRGLFTLAPVALVIFLLCATPAPFENGSLRAVRQHWHNRHMLIPR